MKKEAEKMVSEVEVPRWQLNPMHILEILVVEAGWPKVQRCLA